ncbi:hypothetical protein H310_13255 [Aphanomyces invadans]|uniref:Uncharacterized protein n=1 Tax=Aphanomyces invadans TaxID=157072 RepID=A0A024TDY5_9STRA|nr:hypothetical protein H310_13255 [Aphanomyces invadans]ETV92355.1 hypothetical protein H310_13255 [Aphanomyces invadans]|eukprot:XP_008878906.1 hypothetical protein H310_13255 [Aphanomyces invadans]
MSSYSTPVGSCAKADKFSPPHNSGDIWAKSKLKVSLGASSGCVGQNVPLTSTPRVQCEGTDAGNVEVAAPRTTRKTWFYIVSILNQFQLAQVGIPLAVEGEAPSQCPDSPCHATTFYLSRWFGSLLVSGIRVKELRVHYDETVSVSLAKTFNLS